MKKVSYLLTTCFLISIALISCHKNDDEQPAATIKLEKPINDFI